MKRVLLHRFFDRQQLSRWGENRRVTLVFLGLMWFTITETPVFREAVKRKEPVKVPMLVVFRDYARTLLAGILVCLSTFVLFYLVTVFALSWSIYNLALNRCFASESIWLSGLG